VSNSFRVRRDGHGVAVDTLRQQYGLARRDTLRSLWQGST
jgi:hypothetical protein